MLMHDSRSVSLYVWYSEGAKAYSNAFYVVGVKLVGLLGDVTLKTKFCGIEGVSIIYYGQ